LRYKPTGSESLYYHRNQQYSVTALTDGSGTIVERYAYSAYGVPTITNASATLRTESSYNNRYMYTGREWDQSLQMYHYRARMYDANLGSFCSKDPIGFEGDAFGTYCFLNDRGVQGQDPNGLRPGSGKGERNWGNRRPSVCSGKETIKEMQDLVDEEFKKNGASQHWRELKAWLKILKKAPKCLGPVGIFFCLENTCQGGEPQRDCVCLCESVDELFSSGWISNTYISTSVRTYSPGIMPQSECNGHSSLRYDFTDVIDDGKRGYIRSWVTCGCECGENSGDQFILQ
jgi:RHS repeat-associated protein